MPPVRKILNIMHLLRMELVLTAVSDAWLMVFLAYTLEPAGFVSQSLTSMPLALVLVLAGVVAAGLAAYGLALNDVLDVRHDRAFRPDRPIPAGRIRLTTALSTAVIALLTSLCAASVMSEGSFLLAALVAGGILFYNTTARFLPATGVIVLALLRMLHMFIANPDASFIWPIWLNFSYTIATAAAVHVLVAKRPRLAAGSWWLLAAAWTFWTLALLGWMHWRHAQHVDLPPTIWAGPVVALAGFAIVVLLLINRTSRNPRLRRPTALLFSKLALLWLIVLNASWLLAAGYFRQSLAQLGLFVFALAITWLVASHERQSKPSPGYRLHLGTGRT